MLYHLLFGDEAPLEGYWWAYHRVVIAEHFGWTLDYVDALSYRDRAHVFAVLNARAKYGQIKRERGQ